MDDIFLSFLLKLHIPIRTKRELPQPSPQTVGRESNNQTATELKHEMWGSSILQDA